MKHIAHIAPLAFALLLAGCETMPGQAGSAPAATDSKPNSAAAAPAPGVKPGPAAAAAAPVPAPVVNADLVALKEGLALYNNGDYPGAIKRLSAPEIAGGSKATQLSALKHLAFSYCVTNRQPLCRQQFEKAFKLDPAFDLATGEHGHPLWGPAFKRVKKESAKPAPRS
jgi:hypothetical protein